MAGPWEAYANTQGDGPWSEYGSTGGGAATINPNLSRQGRSMQLGPAVTDPLSIIGGAAALGAGMGAAAPELLSGAANIVGGMPAPISGLRGPLQALSGAARTAGRGVGATAGAISGAASETAGQAAEAAGASQTTAEAARLAAGALGNEPYQLLKTYVTKPALSFASHIKKQLAREILGKVEGPPQPLSEKERQFIDATVAEIRGGPKSDADLQAVGDVMGAQAQRSLTAAGRVERQAAGDASRIGGVGEFPASSPTPIAEIGEGLQQRIVTRQKTGLEARSAEFTKTMKERDAIVAQNEAAGRYPQNLPEYSDIVKSLESELAPGKRSKDVARSFQNILAEIKTKGAPASFQAIDDVRRNLGEVFRGKPPEGYAGIDADTAKRYYGMLSKLQKAYAGESQAKLLDDYASATAGLEIFSSKFGKKATALDQYREGQYPDPSAIPAAFFKTKASVRALQELTDDKDMVAAAALDYARNNVAGMKASQVREWRIKNEWLSEVPSVRAQLDNFASRIEAAERSASSAQDFAKRAASDVELLTRKALPAQRAVELFKSGNTELWAKVIPAINNSPQAKDQMVRAARQVVADMATSKEAPAFFSRNLRPFLERAGIATAAQMDEIASGLRRIESMAIPEPQKMGMQKRMMLNSFGGYTAGLGSRGVAGSFAFPPDPPPTTGYGTNDPSYFDAEGRAAARSSATLDAMRKYEKARQ